jgi:hypothetical protein
VAGRPLRRLRRNPEIPAAHVKEIKRLKEIIRTKGTNGLSDLDVASLKRLYGRYEVPLPRTLRPGYKPYLTLAESQARALTLSRTPNLSSDELEDLYGIDLWWEQREDYEYREGYSDRHGWHGSAVDDYQEQSPMQLLASSLKYRKKG